MRISFSLSPPTKICKVCVFLNTYILRSITFSQILKDFVRKRFWTLGLAGVRCVVCPAATLIGSTLAGESLAFLYLREKHNLSCNAFALLNAS